VDFQRPTDDSPTTTTVTSLGSRKVGPMKKIRWVLVDRGGKGLSEFRDAEIPEDITFIQFWKEINGEGTS
jgi:hypothetical protein